MKKIVAVLLLLTIVSGSVFAGSFFEKDTTVPFLLNLLVGFGVGSYVQGDVPGGVIGTVGELVPLAVTLASSAKLTSDLADPNLTEEEALKISKKALTVSALSSVVLIGVRVFECIRPFTFEKELAASIGAKDINFAAMPVPTSASNVDFALNCKIDF